ncbi:P-loop containing nucleoside triphosphate hydrolase protein [Helicostylum pulchrum]|nr:P-loop containing nucleoside triphosphate hydrolase protein [Helicostylum pulchrum]
MIDHTNSTDFKKVLQEAQPDTYLCQLKFKLPESFYTDVIKNTSSYRINNFIPDFLHIRQDPTTKVRRILIIDAKSSKEMTKSHQFQVASYAFFLQYLIQDIRNLEIDSLGGVWLPSDLEKPVMFRIDLVVEKVKYIYLDVLITISNDSNPEWVLGKKCTNCQFINRCKQDASGTVRSIPYMSEAKATRLKESSMVEIEDLSEMLQNLKIENKIATESTGYEHYVDAYDDNKAKFMGYASVKVAKKVDHNIYIHFQVDNFSQKPFVHRIEVIDTITDAKVLKKVYLVDYEKQLKDKMAAYSDFADHFVGDLAAALELMHEQNSRCLIYVYNANEKKNIQVFLNYLVSSDGKDLVNLDQSRKKKIVSDAMRCLVVLFQDTQLLGLPGIVGFPMMTDIERTSSVGRFVSIEELLQENIALGVSGFYTIIDAVQWLADSYINGKNTDITGFDLSDIFDSWRVNKPNQVKRYIKQRLYWLQDIMRKYWQLADDVMFETDTELFPLECKPFAWPTIAPFRHQILAKLVFFRQLECIKACDETRMDRIRDLSIIDHAGSSDEISIGGLVLDLQGQQRMSQYVTNITFGVRRVTNGPNLQQKLDRLSTDNFKRYILVPDTRESIIETIKYSDLSEANMGNFVKHAIRCVNVVRISEDEIVVAGSSIPRTWKYTRYRLYHRYIDFTTLANIEGLTRIDEQEDLVDVVKLIEDPNSWANTTTDSVDLDTHKGAVKLREEFSMSPSQKDISASIFEKRLQIIWGPPGSGKTEFLALFVNWYIQYFAMNNPKSKDLLIGVTAFTRDAIYHLLKRIEKVQKRHGFQDLFEIIYVHGYQNDKTFEPGSNMIGCSWEQSYTKIRAMKKDETKPSIFVMGATVWSWERIRTKWKTFQYCDMMLLDESTQVLVSDALLAIACLKKPNGKLIVAGDHMQLGPIIKNDYSETMSRLDDPLLFGSIQQCLMRTQENHAIPTREFLLRKGTIRDFGPHTLQLKDNWRMNEELNEFFKQVYGPDYTSRYPKIKLHLDWKKICPSVRKLDLIKSILNPDQSISLVKLECTEANQVYNMVELEAKIVAHLVRVYLTARSENVPDSLIPTNRDRDEPTVMIVTPFNKQRIAIQREVGGTIPVDTVEKMQGQECDLIIACFSCSNKRENVNEFIRDFRRWNVALSRARCKVVILTVDDILNPNITKGLMESFGKTLEPTDGWALLRLLQNWAEEKNSSFEWPIDDM